MPVEQIPGSDLRYYLVAFDKHGVERDDDPDGRDGRLSARALEDVAAAQPAYTDVFFLSHGWKGDVPAARDQYNRWIAAMAACTDDVAAMRAARPGFRPLLVGLHWPSLPWGDEQLGAAASSFAAFGVSPEEARLTAMVEAYADRLADTDAAREALRVIFRAAAADAAPAMLPPDVREAYATLDREANLGADGPGADPGADREPFDPEAHYQAARQADAASFGVSSFGGILSPLRQLSFWKMKDRARTVGEGGLAAFVAAVQSALPAARVHLMGHSFGCIVMSGVLNGPGGRAALTRPVHSAVLVQGALSIWSYCSSIPSRPDRPGYFRAIVEHGRVAGPLVTTQSEWDTAVGRLYPVAAGVAGQTAFFTATPPKYGALGTFGVQGPGCDAEARPMLPPDGAYAFAPGRIYNLEGSEFITGGDGLSGAHNNIDRPAVAHAVWAAARVEV